MKKSIILIATLIAGLALFSVSCEVVPQESCEQEMFCNDTEEVTACCTEGADCVFKYNGVEYPDTEQGMIDLINALDCTDAKSDCFEQEKVYMMDQLRSLMTRAHDGLGK